MNFNLKSKTIGAIALVIFVAAIAYTSMNGGHTQSIPLGSIGSINEDVYVNFADGTSSHFNLNSVLTKASIYEWDSPSPIKDVTVVVSAAYNTTVNVQSVSGYVEGKTLHGNQVGTQGISSLPTTLTMDATTIENLCYVGYMPNVGYSWQLNVYSTVTVVTGNGTFSASFPVLGMGFTNSTTTGGTNP